MQGSAEAVAASLEALSSQAVTVKAVQAGLGAVCMSDIDMAVSMGAKVVAFNVKASNSAVNSQAKQRDVRVLRHNIIYHLLQEARPAVTDATAACGRRSWRALPCLRRA